MPAPRRIVVFLGVGLLAASQSGNIIRLGDASPMVIAAWRLLIASLLLAPLAGRRLGELRSLSRREVALLVAAGFALAAHFVVWIAAVQMTTVANATVFFAVNPVITASAGHFLFGERITRPLLLSIGVGLLGVVVLALGDLQLDPEQIPGDVLKLAAQKMIGRQRSRAGDHFCAAPRS